MGLDRRAGWNLWGYWPEIMEQIHLIDLNIKLFLIKPIVELFGCSKEYQKTQIKLNS
jgi:hypothetical protein